MIRKRIKRIYKLSVLIAVRQIWKLSENLYHLINQPFLTIKKLIKTKDKSQIFLLLTIITGPIIVYIGARIIWDYYRFGLIIKGVGMFFLIASGIEFFLLTYLGYWLLKVIKNK